MRQQTPKELELECFVHGAMCVLFSGRCLILQYMLLGATLTGGSASNHAGEAMG